MFPGPRTKLRGVPESFRVLLQDGEASGNVSRGKNKAARGVGNVSGCPLQDGESIEKRFWMQKQSCETIEKRFPAALRTDYEALTQSALFGALNCLFLYR